MGESKFSKFKKGVTCKKIEVGETKGGTKGGIFSEKGGRNQYTAKHNLDQRDQKSSLRATKALIFNGRRIYPFNKELRIYGVVPPPFWHV